MLAIILIFLNIDSIESWGYQDLHSTRVCSNPFPSPIYEKNVHDGDKWAAHLSNRIRLLGMPSLVIAPSGFAGRGDHILSSCHV